MREIPAPAGNKPISDQRAGSNLSDVITAPAFSLGEPARGCEFSRQFWSQFAREHWEKKPALLRRPFDRPLIAPAEMFQAALDACKCYRSDPESVPLSFYIEHERKTASIDEYLPVAADEDLEGYASRISGRLRGQRFALIIEHIQAHAPEIWERFRHFLRGLDGAVPVAGVNRKATVFIGDYGMTPSGLHVGTSGNFKFVVSGRKRVRLWPNEFFRGRKGVNHTKRIEPFLGDATTIEGEPGDVIYWPSDQWHVGEAIGGPAVSVSLAIFVHSRARQPSAAEGRSAIATRLNRKTGGGFARVPRPQPVRRLSENATVTAIGLDSIVWESGATGEIVCSACGHSFALPNDAAAFDLLARLNRGERSRVRGTNKLARALLEKLLSLRAISEVRGEQISLNAAP